MLLCEPPEPKPHQFMKRFLHICRHQRSIADPVKTVLKRNDTAEVPPGSRRIDPGGFRKGQKVIFLQITPSILGLDKTSLLYRLGAPVLMIPAMILITWCMRKVPVIRRIVP